MAHLRFAAPVEQRAALITGGARGIGGAAALRLAEAGRHIAIVDVLAEPARQRVREIEALGPQALFVEADVTDEGQVHCRTRCPRGRYSDAAEVAEVIEFLCSERNTYTTGSVWSVKGGRGEVKGGKYDTGPDTTFGRKKRQSIHCHASTQLP